MISFHLIVQGIISIIIIIIIIIIIVPVRGLSGMMIYIFGRLLLLLHGFLVFDLMCHVGF